MESYLVGQRECEEVEPVGVPLRDDLAQHFVVAHLARSLSGRVRRLGRRLQDQHEVYVWVQSIFVIC